MRARRAPAHAVLGLWVLGACHEESRVGEDAALSSPWTADASQVAESGTVPSPKPEGGAASLPDAAQTSEVQPAVAAGRFALCARAADDAVRDVFCTGDKPSVTSLRELALRLKIEVLPVDVDEKRVAALEVDPYVQIDNAVFLGVSTALSGQLVSPINPRAILLSQHTFIAFQRGVQKVEIATADRVKPRLNFYLLSFKQACNARATGCTPGDLYTLSIERDWLSITLEDDEDLKNTPLDCRQCHQRGRDTPSLLMRELRGPWPHFFALQDANGALPGGELMRDYRRAKGNESYAGIPGALMDHTAGGTLQNVVDPGQPLEFDGATIEAELQESIAAGRPRRSATWDAAYAAFKRGEQLSLPYYELRSTDPDKQAALSQAYARFQRGEISADALPDLADIFPNDPQVRAEIGLQTEPGAPPAEALIQACTSCHNDVLDQTISRARFSIALSRMTRAQLDLAITRIEQPAAQPGVMPPPGMRQLDAEGRARVSAYLRQNRRSPEDDALLENAARIGMAREANPRF